MVEDVNKVAIAYATTELLRAYLDEDVNNITIAYAGTELLRAHWLQGSGWK